MSFIVAFGNILTKYNNYSSNTVLQSNLSIATIKGNSEKGRIRQGVFI